MREVLTTALDVLGLLLVAAGVAALLLPLVGWGCLLAAGVIVLVGSGVSARLNRGDQR